ncbi:MAG: hypothetical protein JO127_05380 [Caulobacteraceae bacterium]|nr:hypothetical protein [Caulobacteraceae bacterium]
MAISRTTIVALAAASLAVGAAFAQEAGANFDLPRGVLAAATAFQAYTARAAAVGRFSGSQSVAEGLRAGVSYEPVQLEEGMIAYGAIAALREGAFVEGVREAARDGYGREALADRLVSDPYEVGRIDGAAGAARRVDAVLAAQAAPLLTAGAQVKQAAYAVQHQAWSHVTVADGQGRLAEVKRLSATRAVPTDAESLAMLRSMETADSARFEGRSQGLSEVEAKALALAAEAVLRGRRLDEPRLAPLLSEPRSAQCLRMAKLNLYQCMAVAGPQYEDIYCLGQHAMFDTGACVRDAVERRPARVIPAASYSAYDDRYRASASRSQQGYDDNYRRGRLHRRMEDYDQ